MLSGHTNYKINLMVFRRIIGGKTEEKGNEKKGNQNNNCKDHDGLISMNIFGIYWLVILLINQNDIILSIGLDFLNKISALIKSFRSG